MIRVYSRTSLLVVHRVCTYSQFEYVNVVYDIRLETIIYSIFDLEYDIDIYTISYIH